MDNDHIEPSYWLLFWFIIGGGLVGWLIGGKAPEVAILPPIGEVITPPIGRGPRRPISKEAIRDSWTHEAVKVLASTFLVPYGRLDARATLPATQHAARIIQAVDEHPVVLVCGATGCGKLTQVPQLLLDTWIERGVGGACEILCTQPRSLAAMGFTSRVAYERAEEVGDVNGTSGDLHLAVDAVVASKHSHCFLSVSSKVFFLAAIVSTSGNDTCHLILRGGKSGPNYQKDHVNDASARMVKANLIDNIIVDCSHVNSQKKPKNQIVVAANIANQLRDGDDRIIGVMLESNIEEGNQPLTPVLTNDIIIAFDFMSSPASPA
ncbi:hypothetical protein PsorP6_000187 [Peronosclerospora sorghi]|uniref:Uncharacterized protein n=1 Tax=Peronosclerospora sorghi TaxID=230839 RepID=A0ACC0WQJ2_9STRA|nr:hypothetical protein PsorP6_000187 [Peronosclerospora sorghi]